MLNMVLLAIILILLIVCLILLTLLVKSTFNKKEEKVKYDPHLLDDKIEIEDLMFPKKVEEMSYHLLIQSCVKVFESFKALNYANKNEAVLSKVEWHSWQVSLLLCLIKKNTDFFIPNLKPILHPSIYNKSSNYIFSEMKKIQKKYYDNVNIENNRDILSKDIIWSVKEVSIIFYFMQKINKYK